MKIRTGKLDLPMSLGDFKQVTLLANMIAICQIVIRLEPSGTERRAAYANMHKDAKRIENSIPGHLHGRSIDASTRFYADMESAVGRFLKSFDEYKPPVRDSKGRLQRAEC